MWLQLDGAPPHYYCEVWQFLNADFQNRWIGRNGFENWPPRSPDLTPLDFFLWELAVVLKKEFTSAWKWTVNISNICYK
ncbi:hypothetical protein D910_00787 [Dendroctonus ponderosae]|uniref:Tc1-like transposase DDE domain-containing protein n=1 Tax=Dendroctonus ponderosae TaxID=77166 RepID=U4UTZ7_DENPD|nr:hypothetical protein D910_00787 [Dendroctonus ponderosae]